MCGFKGSWELITSVQFINDLTIAFTQLLIPSEKFLLFLGYAQFVFKHVGFCLALSSLLKLDNFYRTHLCLCQLFTKQMCVFYIHKYFARHSAQSFLWQGCASSYMAYWQQTVRETFWYGQGSWAGHKWACRNPKVTKGENRQSTTLRLILMFCE